MLRAERGLSRALLLQRWVDVLAAEPMTWTPPLRQLVKTMVAMKACFLRTLADADLAGPPASLTHCDHQ